MKNKFYKYLDAAIKEKLCAVDALIIDSTKTNVDGISSAIKSLSQGKKIRAILALLSFALCGGAKNEADVNAATAIELIHTATLLHDDVVDDNFTRRGVQNPKSLFGNKISVLSGDFILSIAFNLIVACKNLEATQLLSGVASKLAEGEVMQLDLSGGVIKEEEYFKIIGAKSATLFSAACEIAAILTNKKEYKKNLADFGYNLGIAFQIIDDVLDYAGSASIGKQICNDFYNSKFTLPCIIAYSKATLKKEKLLWEEQFFYNKKCLPEIMACLQSTNAINEAKKRAEQYIDLACDLLSIFDNCKYRIAAQSFLRTILVRTN